MYLFNSESYQEVLGFLEVRRRLEYLEGLLDL